MDTLKQSSCLAVLVCCIAGTTAFQPAFGQTPSGELRVLLMVVDGSSPVPRSLRHYENGQVTNTTWTDVATIHHYAFERDSSFARLFEEMSFGQMTIAGDSLLMAFPQDASALTWRQWTALADAEARNRGYDLSAYDRFLYILPFRPPDVYGSGLASGAQALCTYATYVELSCLFHELGHTIGFRHAAELGPDGTTGGSADESDGLMGSAFNAHVNVVNKYLAGWLTGARLQTVDAPGSATFTLAPQSRSAEAPQVVRIVNPGARPAIGVVDTFVSFRDTGGFDGQLIWSAPDLNGDAVANAVLIHQGYRSGSGDTLYLRALQPGQSYAEFGVGVAVDAITGDGATVTVTRVPYVPSPPKLTVKPKNFNAQPWQFRYYTVSVSNPNDPAEVPFDSFYDLAFTPIGAGWMTGWGGTIEGVPPGTTRDFSFLVAAPSLAALGSYDFTITATDAGGDDGPVSASAPAAFTVVGPGADTDPPGATTGLQGSAEAGSVSLTWSAATDAASGIAGYDVFRADDSAPGHFPAIGSTTKTHFRDTTVTPGRTYRYTVGAIDGAGNVGPDSEVFAIGVPLPACSDGIDNDGDQRIDYPADPGCAFADGTEEDPECDDGVDNDGDGRVDFEDPECDPSWPYWESPAPCGLGFELALLLPPLMRLRARRQRGADRRGRRANAP
jgi:hypothetical protein